MNQNPIKTSYPQKSDFYWKLLIGVLIILVTTLHYSTAVHLHQLHEIYRILFYIPIILAAFRYQIRGGLISSLIVIAIYLPHVVFQWGGDFLFNFSRFLQMIMYLVIGSVAGILAQRERNERNKYQHVAIELQRSYEQLKTQSEKLAEIEEQLRHSERLSILGELAASLAHEVRNPLGSIWGVVEILQDKFDKRGQDSEFMDLLVKEVKRLNEVVENYLTLSRRPTLLLQSCNLQEIVQSVIYLLNSKATKHHIQLKANFPDQPILIKADENQIRQVLINLILNSIAAISDHGSVTVKAELALTNQMADENKNPYSVLLSIIDTGHGMDQEIMNKIFQPFYTTREEGTGLGLSIVKRIADQNKWKIRVESKPGQGTKITLIFPPEVINA